MKNGKIEEGNSGISIVIIITAFATMIFRWTISIGSYSGEGKPPMYGDFEAQRHWMELTINLPIREWYVNSSSNNLLYWGLDYPPLTAYHSWLMGTAARKLNSSWVTLFESRGFETYYHKLFMRSSVIFTDLITFIPAICIYVRYFQKPHATHLTMGLYIAIHLFYPGLILMDYGHFQLIDLVKLAVVVIFSFGLIWLPFLSSIESVKHVVSRLFPFHRGLFEDKVANVWCSFSPFIKWQQLFSPATLLLSSICLVLLAIFPCSLLLFFRPSRKNFKKALIIASLSFFLFSFQVHEKTILLTAIPALLLIDEESLCCSWLLMISVISLFPLCVKDGLTLSFFALSPFYYVLLCDVFRFGLFRPIESHNSKSLVYLFHGSMTIGFLLCAITMMIPTPPQWPDFFSLLNAIYCCIHLVGFLVFFNYGILVDNGIHFYLPKNEPKLKTS